MFLVQNCLKMLRSETTTFILQCTCVPDDNGATADSVIKRAAFLNVALSSINEDRCIRQNFKRNSRASSIKSYTMSEPKSEPIKRAMKTTSQQYRLYLTEMRENECLRLNKITPENPNSLQESWEMLATKLNAIPGPKKDVRGWKKVTNSPTMLPSGIIIPNIFNYKIKEVTDDDCVTLYAGIKNLEECDSWILEYSILNSTKWLVREGGLNLKRVVCAKRYVCHRGSVKKRYNTDKKLNYDCEAKITISVKLTTKDTVKKHPHVREGLPAVIVIYNKHTHNTDALSGLLPASSETRRLFQAYFESGMNITESISYHLNKLGLEANEVNFSNDSVNPKFHTVQHWYDKWRSVNLVPRLEKGTLMETFSDWRSLARQRFNRLQQNTTNERPLNELERELISLTAKTDKHIVTSSSSTMVIPEFGFGSPPDSTSFDAVERVLELRELPALVVGDGLPPLSLVDPELPPAAPPDFPTEFDPLDIKCETEDPEVQHQPPEVVEPLPNVKITERRKICRKRKMKRGDVTGFNDTCLRSIAESLKKITRIKKKNYKLRKLRLRLEHPDVNLISLSSSDSE